MPTDNDDQENLYGPPPDDKKEEEPACDPEEVMLEFGVGLVLGLLFGCDDDDDSDHWWNHWGSDD